MEPIVFKGSYPYTKSDGTSAVANLDFVDIPPGTLLFRGVRLPDISKGEDTRRFFRDFLGIPIGDSFCLTPIQNVFFYPFPHIPFGAETYGVGTAEGRYNAIQVYVTRKALRLVCMISPSQTVRGTPKGFDGNAPIQRCSRFDHPCKGVSEADAERRRKANEWDNCVHPLFAKEMGVNGWMAIADRDSLDVLTSPNMGVKNSPLSKYLLERNDRSPGSISQMLTWIYTDNRRHRGIPEISLHPWVKHPGEEIIYTDAANEEEAIEAIMANADKFAYLPLACITANGVLDGINTDFLPSNIGENTQVPPSPSVRGAIELQTDKYLAQLQTTGIEIPGLGLTKLTFDTRTGFYVMDTFVQKSTLKGYSSPYSKLLLPLETPEQREFSILYSILYRSFVPSKHMGMEVIAPNTPPVYRGFIFERPPALQQMFTNLEKPIPKFFQTPSGIALEEARGLGRLAAPRSRKAPPRSYKQQQQNGGQKTRKLMRKMWDETTSKLETISKQSEKYVSKQLGALQMTLLSALPRRG